MVAIGSFEAKTHLARFLERAQEGEEIVITKHGKPVAKLIPAFPKNFRRIVRIFKEIDEMHENSGFGRQGDAIPPEDGPNNRNC